MSQASMYLLQTCILSFEKGNNERNFALVRVFPAKLEKIRIFSSSAGIFFHFYYHMVVGSSN